MIAENTVSSFWFRFCEVWDFKMNNSAQGIEIAAHFFHQEFIMMAFSQTTLLTFLSLHNAGLANYGMVELIKQLFPSPLTSCVLNLVDYVSMELLWQHCYVLKAKLIFDVPSWIICAFAFMNDEEFLFFYSTSWPKVVPPELKQGSWIKHQSWLFVQLEFGLWGVHYNSILLKNLSPVAQLMQPWRCSILRFMLVTVTSPAKNSLGITGVRSNYKSLTGVSSFGPCGWQS